MDGDISMEEWKDPNHRGADDLMPALPAFLEDEFSPAPDGFGECDGGGGGSKLAAAGGFEKHGLSVAVGSPPRHPPEGGVQSPLPPPTPQFFQKPAFGGGSLADRRARGGGGFSNVTKLSVPCNPPAAAAVADISPALAPSPYLTIPPGLSPTTLLESPIFLSNAMGQASPTTGKLHMLGGANDNDPIRFETPPIEGVSSAFSFKTLNLKYSHYMAEENKESQPNNQHQISVKTEANIQTAQEATNLQSQSQLMQQQQQQHNGHSVPKSGGSCKLSRPATETAAAAGEGASPPDHGQPSAAAAIAPLAEDGYSWRKYGQKQVKHSEYPRSYYKCTHANCVVKKKVERSHDGHVTEIIYKGTHNHAMPTPAPPPTTATRRPQPVQATDHAAPDAGGGGQLWQQDWRAGGEGGLEVTSSPSVPGELCDSTASPDGVDVTSAASDEVERDDNKAAAHVPPHAGDESDELERKRRKLESSCAAAMEMNTAASRAVREPRVVIQTTSEVDILDDGYRWRKYGQKVVKGNPNPRSYYKCTHPGCLVRKHVERASHDLKSVITTYEGKHNHEVPAARNSAGGHTPASSSQHHAGVGVGSGRRPEVPSMHDSLMRLGVGGCGAVAPPPFAPRFAALHLPPTTRDPLAPMSNFPYSLGHVAGASPALASLPPMPPAAGLAGVEGLKYPMLGAPSSVHPLLRHRQGGGGMETVGPKGEVKQEAMPPGGGGVTVSGGGRGAAVYQQAAMSRMSLGNQL